MAKRGFKALAKKKTVRRVAGEVARRGTEVLANVAMDALQGQNIGESLKSRSRGAAIQALVGDEPPPPRARKALKQRKRYATSSIVAPKRKRRRRTHSRAAFNREELF